LETVNLDLGDDSYTIFIGGGLLDDGELLRRHISGKQVLIVTNETVAPLYLARVKSHLSEFTVEAIELPDGEQFKTLDTLNLIFTRLIEMNANRAVTLVALGGGVVGDMTGFAAACYQRGVAFIQIPTTVLSHVDSSVGGKTAVNHPLGKNMIGAFHQPKAVIIDPELLSSLPERELRSGLAEVIKHGAMASLEDFCWLEENISKLLSLNISELTYALQRNCQIKANIVSQDERESGVRALLNFGHTFGHAIENSMGYGNWLHGEAVAAGMVMAADLSVRIGMCTSKDAIRLRDLIAKAGLPIAPPEASRNEFLDIMYRDKKVTDTGLKLILLRSLGHAEIVEGVSEQDLLATVNSTSLLGGS
jgi:3-dehydroquinate synthase